MRKFIVVAFAFCAVLATPSPAFAASITRDQAERVARWYTIGLDLIGNGDRSGVRVLGCREYPRSWFCQMQAPGETIVLNPDGTPVIGVWRFALRVSGSGCRVTVLDDGERATYRACPR